LGEESSGNFRAIAGRGRCRRHNLFVAGLITIGRLDRFREKNSPRMSLGHAGGRCRAQTALTTINWRSVEKGNSTDSMLVSRNPAPNSSRRTVRLARDSWVYVIEGPMGCAKKQSGVAAAYQLIAAGKAAGLYFALPTQSPATAFICACSPSLKNSLIRQKCGWPMALHGWRRPSRRWSCARQVRISTHWNSPSRAQLVWRSLSGRCSHRLV